MKKKEVKEVKAVKAVKAAKDLNEIIFSDFSLVRRRGGLNGQDGEDKVKISYTKAGNSMYRLNIIVGKKVLNITRPHRVLFYSHKESPSLLLIKFNTDVDCDPSSGTRVVEAKYSWSIGLTPEILPSKYYQENRGMHTVTVRQKKGSSLVIDIDPAKK